MGKLRSITGRVVDRPRSGQRFGHSAGSRESTLAGLDVPAHTPDPSTSAYELGRLTGS